MKNKKMTKEKNLILYIFNLKLMCIIENMYIFYILMKKIICKKREIFL